MSYGFIIPAAGQNLLAGLLTGEQLRLSRVMIGAGRPADDADPSATGLIAPVAEATSTVPVVVDNTISMVIEYRNEMHGGLAEGFMLNEYGIYALDQEDNEVLLYYGTLGDTPQPVPAYAAGQLSIIRYPVTIAISTDLMVAVEYALGATEEDIAQHNADHSAHPPLRETISAAQTAAAEAALAAELAQAAADHALAGMEGNAAWNQRQDLRLDNHEWRIARLEDAVFNDITGNPFTILFDTLDGLDVSGVWNMALQRIEF